MPVAMPMSRMLLMMNASNQSWFTMLSYVHHASLGVGLHATSEEEARGKGAVHKQ